MSDDQITQLLTYVLIFMIFILMVLAVVFIYVKIKERKKRKSEEIKTDENTRRKDRTRKYSNKRI